VAHRFGSPKYPGHRKQNARLNLDGGQARGIIPTPWRPHRLGYRLASSAKAARLFFCVLYSPRHICTNPIPILFHFSRVSRHKCAAAAQVGADTLLVCRRLLTMLLDQVFLTSSEERIVMRLPYRPDGRPTDGLVVRSFKPMVWLRKLHQPTPCGVQGVVVAAQPLVWSAASGAACTQTASPASTLRSLTPRSARHHLRCL
jgi:hypothetical protein